MRGAISGPQQVQINYYLMDIELLFSRQPFVQQEAGRFAWIAPNATQTVTLDGAGEQRVTLPAELEVKNVVIEAVAGGSSPTWTGAFLNVVVNF